MTTFRRSSTRHRMRLLAVPLAAALVASACGGNDDSAVIGDDAPEETEAAPEATDLDDEGDGGDATEQTDPPEDDGDDDEPTPETTTGGVDETLPPEVSDDPVAGGTLRYGLEAETDGINPTVSALAAAGYTMGNAVFDTLASTTPDGQWVPYLAESFTPSEDFTQWTVKLREGVTFHDGEPLNADAVIFNFEKARNDPLVGNAIKPFYPEEGGAVAIDDLTIQFTLLDASRYWPVSVAGQLGMIGSPKWLAASAEDGTLNQAPVGTGPFVFDNRVVDSVTRFVRNENWWNGEVYLDAIEFYPVDDSASRVDLLFGGELDAMQTTDPASILDLRDDDSLQNVITDQSEESFAMINSETAPFDDIRARKALTLATPRQNYIDLIGLGETRPADQMFTPDSPYYNPDVKQEADDPEAALPLVAEYCAERGTEINPILGPDVTTCTDGKINIELQWSGPDQVDTRIADLLIEGWSGSFNVTRDEDDQPTHVQETALGQYNVNTWRQFGAEDPAPDNVWLLCRTAGGISLNWPRLCDEERDALLLEAITLENQADRVPLYQQVSAKINQDYTYIFFQHTTWANTFTDEVRGACDHISPEGEQLACTVNGRSWFDNVWMG